MAGKIPPGGGMTEASARFKAAGGAFVAFIFWVIAALVFPYPVLIPYWPEAVTWGPAVLYLLAFFNLLKALYQAARAVRLAQAPRLGTQAPAKPRRGLRTGQPIGAKNAVAAGAKDTARAAARLQATRTPTVQRMR